MPRPTPAAHGGRSTLRLRASPGDHEGRLSRLAGELHRRWAGGARCAAEDLLAEHPDLAGRPDAVLRLVGEEIWLREERGEAVEHAELARRFPHLRDQLALLLDCHELFRDRPPDGPQVGATVGDFRLLAELGRGGQGWVFLAAQRSLANRLVALKFVPDATAEHLCLARLQHTHVVPLYSAHPTPDGRGLLLCMPYFGSRSLAAVLRDLREVPAARRTGRDLLAALDREGPGLPPLPRHGPARHFLARVSYAPAVCWLGACLADALHYAHERDLVHLDVKPSNVLLTADGQPMLLDFHLARPPLRPDDGVPAWVGGTPGYMPPEQRLALADAQSGRPVAAPVDARADVYSLGVLLCEALGGRPTPEGSWVVPADNPRVSRGLADVLRRCVAADPADRYGSAAELADDLRRHLNDRPLRGVPNRSLAERWHKWRRRNPYLLAGRLVGAGVLAAALALALWAYRPTFELFARREAVPAVPRPARPVPTAAEEQHRRGRAALDAGRGEEASDHFARAVALEPARFAYQFAHGECAYRLGRWDTAVAAFGVCVALAEGTERARCHVNRGLAYARLGRPAAALADYDRALELDPHLASAALNRGVLQLQEGRHAAAEADLRRALDLGAAPGPVLFNLALAHQARGERARAVDCLRQALHHDPADAKAARWLDQLNGD